MLFPTSLTSIVILTSSMISGVSATCHKSGVTWPTAYNVIKSYVETECRKGAFKGTFKPGEIKYKCVQYGGYKLEFSITNKNTRQSFDLQDQHCIDGLYNEIAGCTRGGVNEVAGWVYSSDPNEGNC